MRDTKISSLHKDLAKAAKVSSERIDATEIVVGSIRPVERDLQKDKEIIASATPGPWRWDVNRHTNSLWLESRRWVVMDFVRWGMQSAQPRFLQENLLEKASDLAVERKAHHVGFDMDIPHPDAQFIAEAREGWPHALERAIKAEAGVMDLVELLEKAVPVLEEAIGCIYQEGYGTEKESWLLGEIKDLIGRTKEGLE